MKKITLFIASILIYVLLNQLNAQNVATLHSSGVATMFTSGNPLIEAYQAAENGDTIYLSGGIFAAPEEFAKSLTVFGTGHNPEHTTATGATNISGEFILVEGADNSHFEGITFLDVLFASNQSVNDVVFKRCKMNNKVEYLGTDPYDNVCSNTIFSECIFATTSTTSLDFSNATNLTIQNCIINEQMSYLTSSTVKNSISFGERFNRNPAGNLFENNIINLLPGVMAGTGNVYTNNIIADPDPSYGSGGQGNDNWTGVSFNSIFVLIEELGFSYDDNYNLIDAETYIGSDETQVGLFGGDVPFKESAVPGIPHVKSKNMTLSTDDEGKLHIELEVEAQDY
jgi:hypothetical protein